MGDDDGGSDTYKVTKEAGDIDGQQKVSVEAPSQEEAMEMFEEVWDDDE